MERCVDRAIHFGTHNSGRNQKMGHPQKTNERKRRGRDQRNYVATMRFFVMIIWGPLMCSRAFLSHQLTSRSFRRTSLSQTEMLQQRQGNNDSSSSSEESSSSTAFHTNSLKKSLARGRGSTASTVATTAAVTVAGAAAVAVTAKVAPTAVAASSSPSSAFLGGALSGFVEKLLISPAKFWSVLKAVGAFALQDYKDWL
jgi:cytoskeletal protein RodZ